MSTCGLRGCVVGCKKANVGEWGHVGWKADYIYWGCFVVYLAVNPALWRIFAMLLIGICYGGLTPGRAGEGAEREKKRKSV